MENSRIKFRARDVVTGEIFTQLYMGQCFQWVNYERQNNIIIEQFTGLKDKHGVDIYEGDIVDGVIHSDYSTHKGFILFDYNGYRIKTSTKSVGLDLTDKLTVIGNVHQNEGLLNENN